MTDQFPEFITSILYNLILFHSEGYRSGHNEAVLKTVCLHGHVGSNPTPSARKTDKFRLVGFSTKCAFRRVKFAPQVKLSCGQ